MGSRIMPTNLSLASCDLLHTSCCDTMGIYRNMCQLGLVKICWAVLEISRRKIFCVIYAVFWTGVTLTFDLLTPKVDRFMPLPRGSLVPICRKTGSFTFTSLTRNEQTDRERNVSDCQFGMTTIVVSLPAHSSLCLNDHRSGVHNVQRPRLILPK